MSWTTVAGCGVEWIRGRRGRHLPEARGET